MNEFYDEILTAAQQDTPKSEPPKAQPFDKAAYAERKRAERDSAYRLIDDAAERAMSSQEAYSAYLNVQARFHRYSVNNALLITAQNPEATKLGTFEDWQKAGVQINTGEKGIMLLEPGREYMREDGSTGASINVKKVFDISQTDADRQQPEVHRDQRLMMRALVSNAPCRLAVDDGKVPANAAAVYNAGDRTIYVRHGLKFDDMFRALSRELAFAHLDDGKGFSRNNLEFKARSIAYLVCARNQIAPDPVSVPASYGNQDKKVFKQDLDQIRDVANTMHSAMDVVLGRKSQEQQHAKNPNNRDVR